MFDFCCIQPYELANGGVFAKIYKEMEHLAEEIARLAEACACDFDIDAEILPEKVKHKVKKKIGEIREKILFCRIQHNIRNNC